MKNEKTDRQTGRATRRTWSVGSIRAITVAGDRFVAARGGALDVPTLEEVRRYLNDLALARPRLSAHTEFFNLQMAAAEIWGTAETAFFARVLREHRVPTKPAAKSPWQRAEREIAKLPVDWQGPFRAVAAASEAAGVHPKGLILSPSRVEGLAASLARWADHCLRHGVDSAPTGRTLKHYAERLHASGTITKRSLGHHLERIASGYFAILSGAPIPLGVNFVVTDYIDARHTAVTKTANQIVGARRIYALGRKHFAGARKRAFVGTEAALQARDGILLMLAAALGQRAKAMAALAFDTTLRLGPRPRIIVDLPGSALKTPHRFAPMSRQCEEFDNPGLWDALKEYRTKFRPVFDGGDAVFPSQVAFGHPLTSQRLSAIMGALTKAHLGVRITLHRVRDNVATEAVEELPAGVSVAAGVLRHKDRRTSEAHYIRQQGQAAMARLAELTDAARGKRTRLKV